MLAILASITTPYIKLAERAYTHTHTQIRTCLHTHKRLRARAQRANTLQIIRNWASRNARALISAGVFSSTGSRPWISTIRLVQHQPRREFRFLRKPPNSIRARAASKCATTTRRANINGEVGGERGKGNGESCDAVGDGCDTSSQPPRSILSSPTTFQPRTSILASNSSATLARCLRRYYVRPILPSSLSPLGNGSFG